MIKLTRQLIPKVIFKNNKIIQMQNPNSIKRKIGIINRKFRRRDKKS